MLLVFNIFPQTYLVMLNLTFGLCPCHQLPLTVGATAPSPQVRADFLLAEDLEAVHFSTRL